MKPVLFFISFLPSWLQKPLRRILGAKIHSSARLSCLSFVMTRNLTMGPRSSIGPLVIIKAEAVTLGESARIRPLCLLKVRTLILGDYSLFDPLLLVNCTYGPRSQLRTGRHCRLLSFSLLEPSEGIFLGDHVALGGHSLVFCHGSWSNYLKGSPAVRGPVHIGNEVWVGWRSMISAGTRIGDRAIISAQSLAHGSIPSNAFFAGVPGRVVLEDGWKEISSAERKQRMEEIIAAFRNEFDEVADWRFAELRAPLPDASNGTPLVLYSFEPLSDLPKINTADLTILDLHNGITFSSAREGGKFADFLEVYGVRTDRRGL